MAVTLISLPMLLAGAYLACRVDHMSDRHSLLGEYLGELLIIGSLVIIGIGLAMAQG